MRNLMNLTVTAILVLSTAALTGCAFGSGTDEQNKAEIQDRNKLLQNFSRVYGTYEGVIYADGRTIPLEVAIFSVDKANGTNDLGETRFLPVLKVRYRQLDTVRPDVILDARFISEQGSLNAGDTTNTDGTTLRGTISAGSYVGVVSKNTGVLGRFELRRTDVQAKSPTVSPEVDYQERLRALYRSLAGTYEGTVTPPPEVRSPFPVRLTISAVEVVKDGKVSPTLKVSWKRLDIENMPEAAERLLEASYQLEITPALLSMSTDPNANAGNGSTVPSGYFLSMTGIMANNTYKADVYDRRGFLGTLVVERK